MDILQDGRGYVWLATEEGLDRFDGLSFKVYKHDPADVGLAARAASSGTSRRTPPATSGSPPPAAWPCGRGPPTAWCGRRSWPESPIRTLRFAPKERVLWIGTRDAGLLRLDVASGALTRFAHDPSQASSLADDRIYVLYLDGKDRLWVGTEAGLDRWDAGGFVHFRADPADPSSLSDGRVRAILEDDAGALWVGTSGAGLNRLDPATGRFERFRHDPNVGASLAHDQVRALLQDADGRLWVGTSGGLDLLDGAVARSRTTGRTRRTRRAWPTTTSCRSPRTGAACCGSEPASAASTSGTR